MSASSPFTRRIIAAAWARLRVAAGLSLLLEPSTILRKIRYAVPGLWSVATFDASVNAFR